MAHRNTNTAAMLCDYHQKHATSVITQFITHVTMGVKVHQHSRMRTTQQSYDISEYSTVSANKHARHTTLTMKRETLTKNMAFETVTYKIGIIITRGEEDQSGK